MLSSPDLMLLLYLKARDNIKRKYCALSFNQHRRQFLAKVNIFMWLISNQHLLGYRVFRLFQHFNNLNRLWANFHLGTINFHSYQVWQSTNSTRWYHEHRIFMNVFRHFLRVLLLAWIFSQILCCLRLILDMECPILILTLEFHSSKWTSSNIHLFQDLTYTSIQWIISCLKDTYFFHK